MSARRYEIEGCMKKEGSENKSWTSKNWPNVFGGPNPIEYHTSHERMVIVYVVLK